MCIRDRLSFINDCWRLKKIPKTWYEAHVIPIFKKGNRNRCSNYRGISLLNAGYKLYMKIVHAHLSTITEALLLENQSGFRKG